MKSGFAWSILAVAALTLTNIAAAEAARSRAYAQPAGSSTKEIVDFDGDHPQGAIFIKTAEHKLYYTLGDGKAVRYSIAVGKPGFQWSGNLWISAKHRNPSWRPTSRMRRENPRLPRVVGPGPQNPLGMRAMYLGWSEYRIHGTNAPSSIGSSSSSGCFRMHNVDAADLFERAHIGAPVHVLR
jgi:lipoprotein-anchoring transpeptidase ErfK/SrfK